MAKTIFAIKFPRTTWMKSSVPELSRSYGLICMCMHDGTLARLKAKCHPQCSHFPHGNEHVIICVARLFFASWMAPDVIHNPRNSLLSPSLSKNSATYGVAVGVFLSSTSWSWSIHSHPNACCWLSRIWCLYKLPVWFVPIWCLWYVESLYSSCRQALFNTSSSKELFLVYCNTKNLFLVYCNTKNLFLVYCNTKNLFLVYCNTKK